MSAPLDVRFVEGDDFDQYFDVRAQAFGVPGDERAAWLDRVTETGDVASIGAFRGGRLLGALRVIPGGQYVHRRSVPMGGIAAVVVRPEVRGAGVARTLLMQSLTWMRDQGIVVSSLHPASTRAYRSAGWEIAGRAGWLTIPTRSLAAIRGDAAGPVEPLAPTGGPEVRICFAEYAPSVPGSVDRSAAFWQLHEQKGRQDGAFRYGVRGQAGLTGYLAYTQTPDARSWGYDLRVDDVVAHDRASAIALWRFIGGHSMQVERVTLPISALPALSFLLDEQDAVTDLENRWMHRIVDLPGAIAARGFPVGVEGSVVVGVSDPIAPADAPTWRITVANGAGAADAAERGDAEVVLDVGALSALTIGGTSVGLLRNAGRIEGSDDAIARLGGVFMTPTPVITDDF